MVELIFFAVIITAGLAVLLKVGAEALGLLYAEKRSARARCEADIVEGLQAGQLEWEDVWHLAQRWRVGRADLLEILRNVHRKAVAGEVEDLDDKLESAREFLQKYEEREPYAELPENVSLRLTKIEKSDEPDPEQARQLARSLTVFHLECQRSLEKQWRLAFWGIFFGTVGFIVGVLGLYLALSATQMQEKGEIVKVQPAMEIVEAAEALPIQKSESTSKETQEEIVLPEEKKKTPE